MNVPTPETITPEGQFYDEIQTRIGHVAFNSTLAGLVGFDTGFFSSRLATDELAVNFIHGGAGAVALALVAGAVSYVRHRE